MGEILGFWFWVVLLVGIVGLLVGIDQWEDRRQWTETRRDRQARARAQQISREMDVEARTQALQSIAEWKRSR